MPRGTKSADDIFDDASHFRRNPSGGRLGNFQVKITKQSDIPAEELQWMHTRAIMLKAADKSYTYIGDTLRVSKSIVIAWFDDPALKLRDQVVALQSDWIKAARELAEHYTLEAIEGLMEIARAGATDADVARKCYIEILDRVGLVKVAKSETQSTNTNVDTVDGTDFLEKMQALPLETQAQLAALSEEMDKIIAGAEGKG